MFGYVIFLTITWFILGGRSPLALVIGFLLSFAIATLIHAEVGKNPPLSEILKGYLFYPRAITTAILDTYTMLRRVKWREDLAAMDTEPENILALITTITFSPRTIVLDDVEDRKLLIHKLIYPKEGE